MQILAMPIYDIFHDDEDKNAFINIGCVDVKNVGCK